jgi:hypothetical protein
MLEVFIEAEDHGTPCLERSGGEQRREHRGQRALPNESHLEGE